MTVIRNVSAYSGSCWFEEPNSPGLNSALERLTSALERDVAAMLGRCLASEVERRIVGLASLPTGKTNGDERNAIGNDWKFFFFQVMKSLQWLDQGSFFELDI
jgi:hypothetical protein